MDEEISFYSFDLFGTLVGPKLLIKSSWMKNASFLLARKMNWKFLYKPINHVNKYYIEEAFLYNSTCNLYSDLLAKGNHVFITTDSHLSRAAIKDLLNALGLPTPSAIITSSEEKTTKKHKLFSKLIQEFESTHDYSKNSKWLHYGDIPEIDGNCRNYGGTYRQISHGVDTLVNKGYLSEDQSTALRNSLKGCPKLYRTYENQEFSEVTFWFTLGYMHTLLACANIVKSIISVNNLNINEFILIGRDMEFIRELLKLKKEIKFSYFEIKRSDIGNSDSVNWVNLQSHLQKRKQSKFNMCLVDISYRRSIAKQLEKNNLLPASELYLFRRPFRRMPKRVTFMLKNHDFISRLTWMKFREIWEILLCVEKNPIGLEIRDGIKHVLNQISSMDFDPGQVNQKEIEKFFKLLIRKPTIPQAILLGNYKHDPTINLFQSINLVSELQSDTRKPGRSYWRNSTWLCFKFGLSNISKYVLLKRWFQSEIRYYLNKLLRG